MKVFIPFIIGIFLFSNVTIPFPISIALAIIFFIAHLTTSRKASVNTKLTKSYLINIPLALTFVFIGLIACHIKSPKEIPSTLSPNTNAVAIINDIKHKDFSSNLHALA